MRLSVLLPFLLLGGCSVLIPPKTPYQSRDCDTTPDLLAQFEVNTSSKDLVTHVIVDASHYTGWVVDAHKNGMTHCDTEKLLGQPLVVELADGRSSPLVPAAALPGRASRSA